MPLLAKVGYAVLLESHMEPAISLSFFYSYFFNFYKILSPNSRSSFSLLIITTFLFKIGDSISGKLEFSNRKITRSADAWGRIESKLILA